MTLPRALPDAIDPNGSQCSAREEINVRRGVRGDLSAHESSVRIITFSNQMKRNIEVNLPILETPRPGSSEDVYGETAKPQNSWPTHTPTTIQ